MQEGWFTVAERESLFAYARPDHTSGPSSEDCIPARQGFQCRFGLLKPTLDVGPRWDFRSGMSSHASWLGGSPDDAAGWLVRKLA